MNVIPTSGCLTLEEIKQQPSLWNSVLVSILKDESKYKSFLEPILRIENLKIILTGTGASAYIGDTLHPFFEKKLKRTVLSIPTSDIISNPYKILEKSTPTLVITYSRSGNTSETNYCYNILNNFIDTVYHLIITCNNEGVLYKLAKNKNNTFIAELPPEANDKALAMTSGYTSMIFSSILILELDNLSFITSNLHLVLNYSKELLSTLWNSIYQIVEKNPSRIIFLGTDELKGLSNYCALNILKLTNRKVYSLSLNPKLLANNIFPFTDENTLVVLFHSNNSENHKYEYDFIRGIEKLNNKCNIIIVSECNFSMLNNIKQFNLSSDDNLPDCFLAMVFAFFGQILAYLYSLHLRISVDNPSDIKS